MNLSDPTAGDLSPPTNQQWQPPLPTMSPPPMPTSASESITSTPTLITSPNVAQSDLYYNNPTTRLINFNDPYVTPRTDRTIGRSVPWTTPSYHHVQPVFPSTPTGPQWYEGGSLSASPYTPMSAPAVSPANYIAAGFITSQDST